MMVEMLIVGSTAITQEELKNTFYYEDGNLFFKPFVGTRNRISRLSNRKAGYKTKNGYYAMKLNHRRMYLHRMIFLYHHGYLPEQVDHIDGDRGNNKIENLRAADYVSNACNSKKRTDNTSGVKGVWFCNRENRYIAQFQYQKKKYHVGSFLSIEEAAESIKQKREQLVKEFANHG